VYVRGKYRDVILPMTVLRRLDADGNVKLPALDNHGMGTVFEELIRRFNEDNNDETWPSAPPICCSRAKAGRPNLSRAARRWPMTETGHTQARLERTRPMVEVYP